MSNRHYKVRTRNWLVLGALVVLSLASSGCARKGDVAGFVKQQDRPLVYGTVSMLCSDGLMRHSLIYEDGYYCVFDVPAGPVRIAVESNDPEADYQSKLRMQESEEARAALWRPSEEVRKNWVPISGTYKSPEASGLEYDVKSGPNEHDIILTASADPPASRVPPKKPIPPDEAEIEKQK